MKGNELQKIMDAIEGSKSVLNKLVSSGEKNLSTEETLQVSRKLDELINMYNCMFQDSSDSLQGTTDFSFNEDMTNE